MCDARHAAWSCALRKHRTALVLTLKGQGPGLVNVLWVESRNRRCLLVRPHHLYLSLSLLTRTPRTRRITQHALADSKHKLRQQRVHRLSHSRLFQLDTCPRVSRLSIHGALLHRASTISMMSRSASGA